MKKVLSDNVSLLEVALARNAFRISRLENVRWRVDVALASSRVSVVGNLPSVTLRLVLWRAVEGVSRPHIIHITADRFILLHNEVRKLLQLCDTLAATD